MSFSPHDLSGVDLIASSTAIPIREKQFDLVLCTEVLEHVSEPGKALQEIRRVLKPSGHLFISVPFLIGLHEEPHDYYRYTEHGLRYLLTREGFIIKRLRNRGNYLSILIGDLAWPLCKMFSYLSKLTGIRSLYSQYNPLLWLLVIVPQKLYLIWDLAVDNNPEGVLARPYRKLQSRSLGYVVIAQRINDGNN